jgi:ABC-type multidrug transport system ATPase subunit
MKHDSVIRTHHLTRYFGAKAVVRDLNFSVPRGSIVGLLGLNGAGKSTTIRMMLGLLTPTRGRCEIFGKDSQSLTSEDRTRIGYPRCDRSEDWSILDIYPDDGSRLSRMRAKKFTMCFKR